MKNILGLNITDFQNNKVYDGRVFLEKSVSPELEATLDEAYEFLEGVKKKLELPSWMRVVKFISGILAAVTAIAIFEGLGSITLAQAYENAPGTFHLLFASFFIWLVFFIAAKIRQKDVENSGEASHVKNLFESADLRFREEFNIPADAKTVDVLHFKYKIKNGKVKVPGMQIVEYVNVSCKVYARGGALHMMIFRDELRIPLESFTGITKINKRLGVHGWNKETPFNKGGYKKYKMTANNIGFVFFKPYYALHIKQGEDFELLIPPYELDTFSLLTGIEYKEDK